jgi:hypothetical protein
MAGNRGEGLPKNLSNRIRISSSLASKVKHRTRTYDHKIGTMLGSGTAVILPPVKTPVSIVGVVPDRLRVAVPLAGAPTVVLLPPKTILFTLMAALLLFSVKVALPARLAVSEFGDPFAQADKVPVALPFLQSKDAPSHVPFPPVAAVALPSASKK